MQSGYSIWPDTVQSSRLLDLVHAGSSEAIFRVNPDPENVLLGRLHRSIIHVSYDLSMIDGLEPLATRCSRIFSSRSQISSRDSFHHQGTGWASVSGQSDSNMNGMGQFKPIGRMAVTS